MPNSSMATAINVDIETPSVYFSLCLAKGIEDLIDSRKYEEDDFSAMVLTVITQNHFDMARCAGRSVEKAISAAFSGDYIIKYFKPQSIMTAMNASLKYFEELSSGLHKINDGLN